MMDCLFRSLALAIARKARKRIMMVKVHQVWRASCAGSGLVLVRRTGWCAWLAGALLPQRLPGRCSVAWWVLAWQCGGGYTAAYLPSLNPLAMLHPSHRFKISVVHWSRENSFGVSTCPDSTFHEFVK